MSKPPLSSLARLALLAGILLAAAAGVRAKGAPGRTTVPDVDVTDFEDGTQPFFLVTESGRPPAALLSITSDPQKVHDGLFALEYKYQRMSDPMPVLVHPALLTDLDRLEYWIKAERDTYWMTFHLDRDGAQFDALVFLPAGLWTFVGLDPSDFFIDPNSPVQKPQMEPGRNGFYWYGLDLAQVTGPPGPNRLWIDTVAVKRPDLEYEPGPLLLQNGAVKTITAPTLIDGDLAVLGGSTFTSNASRLVVAGDITVFGKGSGAVLREGALRLDSHYRYERQFITAGGGLLRFEDLLVVPGMNAGLSALYGGRCAITGSSFRQGALTAAVESNGRIDIRDTDAPGEFLVGTGGVVTAENTDTLLVWLVAGEGLRAALAIPPAAITDWSLGPAWNRTLTLRNIGHAQFGLVIGEGCELLARGGTLRAVGVVFEKTGGSLSGFHNGDHFASMTFNGANRKVRFEDVTVQAWNFYATGTAAVVVRNSLFGEAIAFDRGTIRVFDSACDGSGGYLGCRDRGEMLLVRSDVLCETVCDGSSRLGITQGTVQGPVTAAGDAVIGLKNCTILGKLIELGNGRIFVR